MWEILVNFSYNFRDASGLRFTICISHHLRFVQFGLHELMGMLSGIISSEAYRPNGVPYFYLNSRRSFSADIKIELCSEDNKLR